MCICKTAGFKHSVQVVQNLQGEKWLMLHFLNEIMCDILEMEMVVFWSPFVFTLTEEKKLIKLPGISGC